MYHMSEATSKIQVDCHFHVFEAGQAIVGARYTPSYDSLLSDWQARATSLGITHGVLVQPSFLGIDNNRMLRTIQQYPKELRGVGVVEPHTTQKELKDLKDQGIMGIRLNLYEDQSPHDALEKYINVLNHLKDVGMHVEIHHNDGLLNDLLLQIPTGMQIVIDHFGRPKTVDEFQKNTHGIDKHLGQIWVKLSAPYRTSAINHHAVFQYWLEKIGPSKLLWGSDWPHTGYESSIRYENQFEDFVNLVDNQELTKKILIDNPINLYWS